MKRSTATLIFALSVFVAPLPAAAQATASTGVVFVLISSENWVPLEGAEVALESFGTGVTDKRGRFAFRDVPPGNYRLSAHKQGFEGRTRLAWVRAGAVEKVEMNLGGFADPDAYRTRIHVPLIRQGNALLVRALLNGRREMLFILDTGATLTMIPPAVAEELGVSTGAGSSMWIFATSTGTFRAPVVALASIQLGEVEARDVAVAVYDQPLGGQQVGILGLSFLSRFRLLIDPPQGFMMLSD